MKKGLALAVALATASAAQASTLLTSWENTADGWSTTALSSFTSTYGVTDGASAAVRLVPSAWNNAIQYGYNNNYTPALLANQIISVDITPEVPIPDGQSLQIVFHLLTGTGTEALSPYTAINNSGTTTLSWDYSATYLPDPATSWTSVRLITNPTGGYAGGNVAFDNLRVSEVPEPVSLAVIGLAGLLLTRRRSA